MAATFAELDWYDAPRWYDAVFDVDTELEADFLEDVSEKHGRPGAHRVLEPACGSGRLVAELAARGWSVTGIDLSRPMLDFAGEKLRARGLDARLIEADMSDFRVPGRYDLAHCLVSTFKYLLTESAARSHLESVARALAPGGIYALGFHLTDYAKTSKTRERWVARSGDAEVVCNIQGWPADRKRRRERVRSRLVVTQDRDEQRSETEWEFRTYDARQVRRLLASVPELEHVATYDFCYDPREELRLSDEQEDTLLILRRR